MDPLDYIHAESKRQSATVKEMGGMCDAYRNLVARGPAPVSEVMISDISWRITGNAKYRQVPAVFNQGAPAVDAQSIPRAMRNLVEGINADLDAEDVHESEADFWTREFLLIHPFADGNGRVASLLRNWMLGTLDNPVPLPYYFGEE